MKENNTNKMSNNDLEIKTSNGYRYLDKNNQERKIFMNEEIKSQDYLSAKDLMKLIPNLTYDNAIKYINEAREEMKSKNIYIPITRPKIALTKIIRKKFGF